MDKVTLPGGKTATLGIRMAEFRELWSSGAIAKLQGMMDGGDLAQAYPVFARMVRSWDVTDEDGQPLDPSKPETYDVVAPNVFMALLKATGEYLSGTDPKN